MPRKKLSQGAIERLAPVEKETVYWDEALTGFGVRVHPTGRKTYVTQITDRTTGRKRKVTLGSTSLLTFYQAKEKARESLQNTREGRIEEKANRDEMTVTELWDLFMAETKHRRKSRTNTEYEASFRNWIAPLMGSKRVKDLSRAEVDGFLRQVSVPVSGRATKQKLKGGHYPALHARSTLSAMLTFAVGRDLMTQNPCMHVRLKQPQGRMRPLNPEEMSRLGAVIFSRKARVENPQPLDIIQLLLLTGARKNEICALKWEFIDLDHGDARLPDSKTGPKTLQFPKEAVEILRNQNRVPGVPWVFPAASGNSHYQGLQKVWESVREEAGIQNVRLHDLRHTFATSAIDQGIAVYTVSRMLSHSTVATTEKYIHATERAAKEASNAIGSAVSATLRRQTKVEGGSEKSPPLRRTAAELKKLR